MRTLGPHPPGDQGYAGEIRRICEAMQIAHGHCGCFWSYDTNDKIKKEMLRACVSGGRLERNGGICIWRTTLGKALG
eukprot:3285222-Pyramimonas_sp.AAC.1